jgi:drug/metabolite transporter (DMT)-like permease
MIRNNSMTKRKNFPLRLAVGLFIAILIDTVLQLVWKSAVLSLPSDGSPWLNVQAALHTPLFLFVILLLPCQFLNWLTVLSNADLSFAQPIPALGYVSVFSLSVFFLKEAPDLVQIAGILCVLAGVWFISQTDHVTQAKEGEA